MKKTLTIIFFLLLKVVAAQFFYQGNQLINFKFETAGTSVLLGTSLCNGVPCSGWIEERDSSNIVVLKSQYLAGKHHGVFYAYFPSGQLKSMGTMVANQKIGIWTEYFASGATRCIEYFSKENLGNIDGSDLICFYENGNIERKQSFSTSVRPNYIYEFTETGDTIFKITPMPNAVHFVETTFLNEEIVSKKYFSIDSNENVTYYKLD